jgi:general secretion pathway protein G
MRKLGFTLVEILAVMVIIGIVIAIALPNIMNAIQAAESRQCAANIRNMDAAINLFYAQNRTWPTNLNTDIAPLLEGGVIPPCPQSATKTYQLDAAANNRRISIATHFVDRTFTRHITP